MIGTQGSVWSNKLGVVCIDTCAYFPYLKVTIFTTFGTPLLLPKSSSYLTYEDITPSPEFKIIHVFK